MQRFEICIESASNLHQICIKSAPNLHQICTKSASNLHQICTKSASNLHQLFISFHQTCTSETLKTDLDIVFETGKDDVLGNPQVQVHDQLPCLQSILSTWFSHNCKTHMYKHMYKLHMYKSRNTSSFMSNMDNSQVPACLKYMLVKSEYTGTDKVREFIFKAQVHPSLKYMPV